MRLFAPRRGPEDAGLLPHGRAPYAELLDQLLGGLVQEVAGARARQVVLTDEGIRFLVRHLRPDQRPMHVRRASALYQPALLRAWKAAASPAEQTVVQETVQELFGDLIGEGAGEAEAVERVRAEELVLSWVRELDPEVRRGLARAMTSLGLRQLGEVGEVVDFDARHHTCEESLFPGDPAAIVAPGWAMVGPAGETILQKALVEFSEEGAS
ncbi:MAG: hypothetical protein AAGA48_20955 [Myxococcota bacterium]